MHITVKVAATESDVHITVKVAATDSAVTALSVADAVTDYYQHHRCHNAAHISKLQLDLKLYLSFFLTEIRPHK